MNTEQIGLEADAARMTPAELAAKRCYDRERARRLEKHKAPESAIPTWDFTLERSRRWYIRLADAALMAAALNPDLENVADAVFRATGGTTPVRNLQPPGRRRWRMRAAWLIDVPFNDPEVDDDASSEKAGRQQGRKQHKRGGRRAGRPR